MTRFILIICSILLYSSTPSASIKLSKKKVTPGITMLMPKSFQLMGDDMLAAKYNYPKRPTAMYTDKSALVDAGVNITGRYWNEDDIEMMFPIYEGSIINNYTTVNFLYKGVKTINKRKFVAYEFVGKVSQKKKYDRNGNEIPNMFKKPAVITYNYIMYTVVKNIIVVVNFNCPERLRPRWQETAQKIIESVNIKHIRLK